MKDYQLSTLYSLIESEEKRIWNIQLISEELIKKESKKLTLKKIIQKENLDALPFDEIARGIDHKFKSGNVIPFKIHSFEILLYPNHLRLSYSHIRLREFKGTHIKSIYNFMSQKVLIAIDKYREDLPF